MINGKSCIKPDTHERWQNAKWQTMCLTDTYKKWVQMEWYANTHTLSKYHMRHLTILANDIIYDRLYWVHICQNAHKAAYDEKHMHTPPKSFHPIMVRIHTIGKK